MRVETLIGVKWLMLFQSITLLLHKVFILGLLWGKIREGWFFRKIRMSIIWRMIRFRVLMSSKIVSLLLVTLASISFLWLIGCRSKLWGWWRIQLGLDILFRLYIFRMVVLKDGVWMRNHNVLQLTTLKWVT